MQQVIWEMVGQSEFALSTGFGRMKLDVLPNGLTLYRSHIEITDPVELVFHGDDSNHFIGTQFFLMGHAEMELSNGNAKNCTPDHAVLMRADKSPTKIRFHEPQVLRHIGVAKLAKDYLKEFGDQNAGVPAAFLEPDKIINLIQRTKAPRELRTIASTLSRMKGETPTEKLMLQGQSLLFFSTVLQAFQMQPPAFEARLEQWEVDAITSAVTSIELNQPRFVDVVLMAQNTRMASARFDYAFRAMTGHSAPEFAQIARLKAAQERLLASDEMVKEIAFDLGYDHVGNFSRAYQKFFGESPRRTRQRNLQ